MAKGHRSQIKRARNANKDTRPSAKLSYAQNVRPESLLSYWMQFVEKMCRQHLEF